jgi:glycine cleavage system H protein
VLQVERNVVAIGIQECFQRTAGRLVTVDLPNEGDDLVQGELCARIRVEAGGVYTVWSPISGRVVQANLALLDDPTLPNIDPYGQGWFVRLFSDAFEEDDQPTHEPTTKPVSTPSLSKRWGYWPRSG